ncbi:MBL fold metallo-hydrolase [Intestinimonas sp.]|uniref:MBL fold metallo-hydrolase n=1 Tax=Intestinimonas sp. TaxID=1965293 RepID=UPI002608C90B|nr:MBL fold metallo-hydrolase [Intestinimonas sp.]
MGLIQLTDRICYLPHEPEVDRPMLAYVRGDKFTLAIDAGYSAGHVGDFYAALEDWGLPRPTFTAITHWHYDHTFGTHALESISIAHKRTNQFLAQQRELVKDPAYIRSLKQEDVHFRREYAEQEQVTVVLSDMEFEQELTLDLGGVTARLFHTAAPHSEDTVCICIPQEGVLFLGDSTSEDFFHDCYMDQDKLGQLMDIIRGTDCQTCILSHCEPLKKEALLTYLSTIRN